MKKLGTVTSINRLNTGSSMLIELEDGAVEVFFSGLPGWNKSLREGDRVKVFYKNSLLAGLVCHKVHKIKENKLTLIQVSA
jgi:hypothetical protein